MGHHPTVRDVMTAQLFVRKTKMAAPKEVSVDSAIPSVSYTRTGMYFFIVSRKNRRDLFS